MDSLPHLFLIIVSLIATGLSWSRIFGKRTYWPIKFVYLVLSAIPLVGPIFYLLIEPPESTPITAPTEVRWTSSAKGTQVWPSFAPLIGCLRRLLGIKSDSER
ncbi:hypothetical protein [Paraherbaspirillum soli]|uniref:Cardiolipin synthase N-terminal domain-containing protein n=1 Tax=Paraherbaspirillum soli TaxID=631222 RepID=A0ABW0MFA4_9BURK